METADGRSTKLSSRRWQLAADHIDLSLLARCRGPVLDVGCGPGRHAAALVGRGRETLGIDTCAAAIAATRRRGAPALQVSVFGAVPFAGQWGTALLLDGNIGIEGDVVRLLTRVGQLLRPGGVVLVELSSPHDPWVATRVRIRHEDHLGDWFPWAWVTPVELDPLARASCLVTQRIWHHEGRWFAHLGKTTRRSRLRRRDQYQYGLEASP
jgi:SAM-dependent methyltransferase